MTGTDGGTEGATMEVWQQHLVAWKEEGRGGNRAEERRRRERILQMLSELILDRSGLGRSEIFWTLPIGL